jgi:hypothetical protein
MLPFISIKRVTGSKPVSAESQTGTVVYLEPVADNKGRRSQPNARPCTPVSQQVTSDAMSRRTTSFIDFQKRPRKNLFDCRGSTSFVLLPVPPLLFGPEVTENSDQPNSPSSARRTSTPQARSPRQRSLAYSVAADRSCPVQKGFTRASESTTSSCLSSSDTARTVISSGPATPRMRSGGSDSTSSGGSGEMACIADALRGKLERALSASLAEVRMACQAFLWMILLSRLSGRFSFLLYASYGGECLNGLSPSLLSRIFIGVSALLSGSCTLTTIAPPSVSSPRVSPLSFRSPPRLWEWGQGIKDGGKWNRRRGPWMSMKGCGGEDGGVWRSR